MKLNRSKQGKITIGGSRAPHPRSPLCLATMSTSKDKKDKKATPAAHHATLAVPVVATPQILNLPKGFSGQDWFVPNHIAFSFLMTLIEI
jgi:hypothetical protein